MLDRTLLDVDNKQLEPQRVDKHFAVSRGRRPVEKQENAFAAIDANVLEKAGQVTQLDEQSGVVMSH